MCSITKYLFINILIINSVLLGNSDVEKVIKNNDLLNNQKNIFNNIKKNSNKKILFYNIKKPKIIKSKINDKCFYIRKIKDAQITLLNNIDKNRIYINYLKKCNTLGDLKNLTNELNAMYIKKGYVTSKVFLKPQNISDEVIELFAIEGKIEKLKKNDLYIKNAFFGLPKKNLNLRDLEIAIENINRLPSNNAKLKLEPGSNPGLTIIDIDNKISKKLNGQFSINNYGQKTTGNTQFSLNARYDNPLNLNDQISINYNTTDKHNKIENSVGNSLNYSIPLSRTLFTLSYLESEYNQKAIAQFNDYDILGKSKTYKLNLNYKLFHNQNHKINYQNSIKHYVTKKYIDKTKIDTSTFSLSQFGIGINYLYQKPGYQTFISLDYMKGIKLFNKLNPTELNTYFKKYNLNLNITKTFSPYKYNFTFHLQHSKDKLFSIDQLSIGGPYSVRGYKKEGLNGNSGFYYRNEITYYFTKKIFSFNSSIYLGLDGGWIRKESDTYGGTLLGEFIGLNFDSSSMSSDIYYSKALNKKNVNQNDNFLGFNFTFKF